MHQDQGGRDDDGHGRQAPEVLTSTQSCTSSKTGPAQSALNLSAIVQMCVRNETKVELNVIAVPGYCTPPVSTWSITDELEQAATLVGSVSHLHVYGYQPAYEAVEDLSWDSLLKAGNHLAEELARLATEFPNRPTIFVTHSLGGVLLKKALLLAHQNAQDPRFRLVVERSSGIIFMGTPHAGLTDEDTLHRYNQVLYSCRSTTVPTQALRPSRHDVFQLANLAAVFEQIATVPTLSVFEYASTGPGVPLVDEQLASISSHAEQLLGVHLTHSELCNLSTLNDDTYSARIFLEFLLGDIVSNTKKWTREVSLPTVVQPDPLNPLNLVPLKLPKTSKISVFDFENRLREDSPSAPEPLPLPLRLHLISNTSTDYLLENRKCILPCFMLPHCPNPDFVGRHGTLKIMDKHLLPSEMPNPGKPQNTSLLTLRGTGGIGKTDLAVEYAHSRKGKFKAIFWIGAGGASQIALNFGRIAIQLGLQTAEEVRSLESSIEITKAWLNKSASINAGENDNWLLIFDNVDNLDVITDYVPYHGRGSVLVTSRHGIGEEHLFSNRATIDMGPLSTVDSATLLRTLVKNTESCDEYDASVELANHLDGLPLAIQQMAGFIRCQHLSIRELMNLYTGNAGHAEAHGFGNHIQQHRHGYDLAAAYSFHGLSTSAMKLLELVAFMSPDRVQEYIFVNRRASKEKGNHLWTDSEFNEVIHELLTSSIIRWDIDNKELCVHRPIQVEVLKGIDEGHRYENFKEVVSLLAEVWPLGDDFSQQIRRWAFCEDLLPHVDQLYQLYIRHSAAWGDFKIDPVFPRLLNKAAMYLRERGFAHEGRPYLEVALYLCEKANITMEPLISDLHLAVGGLANETNDAQSSLDHNILCLTIRHAEAAKDNVLNLGLAFAYNQLGISYMMARKFALAAEYFKQNIEMLRLLNAEPDEFGFPVCNLGLAYWVQGELDDADKTLTDLLLQREKLHGKLDIVNYKYKIGRVLHALGNVRASKAMRSESQGDHEAATKFWDESFAIHVDCLMQYQSTPRRFNHRTADVCHKLAEHHIRRQEHGLAQSYLDRAMSIWGDQQWYKNESARSSFLRGIHLQSLGDVELGNRWVERAKLLRCDILPDEKPRELDTVDFDDLVCFWSI